MKAFVKSQLKKTINKLGYEIKKVSRPLTGSLKVYNFTQPYYLNEMKSISEKYGFEDKVVCEIGSDPMLECSRAAMLLGAREIHSYNYGIKLDDSYDNNIKVFKRHFGKEVVPEGVFDLVFAIATLEHVPDIESFAKNIVYALKPGGSAYLQGEPLWLGPKGHHLWFNNGNKKYSFADDSNFMDDWFHLSMPSKDCFKKYLLSKNIEEDIIPFIWEGIYESNNINRRTPDELVHSFRQLNVQIDVKKSMDYRPQNRYFEIAKNSYSEEDLRTSGLHIFLTKNRDG